MNIFNIHGGFKGTGIYTFNPRAISDEAYGPSRRSVIREHENPLPTATEEVHVQQCESGAADQAQHASASTSNAEILKIPLAVKEANTNAKKSKRITTVTARCITMEEFVRELKGMEAEQQRLEEEKAKLKQGREERRQEKQSHKLKLEILRKAQMEIWEIKKQEILQRKQS